MNGHNYFSYVLGILVANTLRTSVFMRCETHLLLRHAGLKRALRQPLMSVFYNRLCARCLAIGTRNRELYQAHGVPANRLFMVPYTVDNTYFMQAANQTAQVRSFVPVRSCQLTNP